MYLAIWTPAAARLYARSQAAGRVQQTYHFHVLQEVLGQFGNGFVSFVDVISASAGHFMCALQLLCSAPQQ